MPGIDTPVDLSTKVGSLELPAPVMTAAGTAGHGDELGRYVDLSSLGAVVVKSLCTESWTGNPAPRVHQSAAGMLNSVGLQGPGIARWLRDELPALVKARARVVASIWGRTVEDYAAAAAALAHCPPQVIAVEVNLSCPNLDGGSHLFAHDPVMTEEVMSAVGLLSLPKWAKLSPNTDRLVEVAAAARRGGADAVTLTNTLLGLAIDPQTRRPRLGGVTGGLSGPAIRPVALRAVYQVHRDLPDLPILGVGGISSARDAVEFILAGASAVQVGTATFANPRAVAIVLDGLRAWCAEQGVQRVSDLIGALETP